MTAASLGELDRAWLHPFTSIAEHEAHPGLVLVEGRGCRVRDTAGRWYLDAMAGLWCVNVGYGREEIAEAIAAQARRLPYYHGFAGAAIEPAIRLAARLRELAPLPNAQVFCASSGAESNDSQIKLIWHYNNLLGRPARAALVQARQLRFDVALTGSGVVSSQKPLPGSVTQRGALLSLQLSSPTPELPVPPLASDLAQMGPLSAPGSASAGGTLPVPQPQAAAAPRRRGQDG